MEEYGMTNNAKIAIVGCGLIGRSWAMIFSSFGYKIQLYDSNIDHLSKAIELIEKELTDLCKKNLIRGTLSLNERMALISIATNLQECIKDAFHIHECVFDSLTLKQELFFEIDQLLGDENTMAAICSSTSVHLPSLVFNKVIKHKDQCLVAHPVNPPLHVKLVELIPTPETSEEILIRTRLVLDEVGQMPVLMHREVSGFALNRLQYAMFQEAFRLVHDGIMSPDDVDTVVSEGLGPRYAFMGPWMTAHLNATGMSDYLERYADSIYKVNLDCNPMLRIEGEAAQQVVDSMIMEVPINKLAEKRAWRDKCLIELNKIKNSMGTI